MVVPISKFRKDIFSLAATDKIGNVTPLQVINPAYGDSLELGAIELRAEMEKEWEKDWRQL